MNGEGGFEKHILSSAHGVSSYYIQAMEYCNIRHFK